VTAPAARPPDVLVLGGGGVLGEAWMSSLLAGIAAAGGFDARQCSRFLGTSAGSIVAASLVAGMAPGERLDAPGGPAQDPAQEQGGPRSFYTRPLELALALGGTAAAPLASLALRSGEAGGALLRRAVLARVPRGRRDLGGLGRLVERSGARFDGRLLVAAVEAASGRRVVFGAPGAPPASVAQAVMASCAIPGVFRPVRVGGRDYLDGGAWSPTNMDALGGVRGQRVLCLNPTGSLRPGRAALAGALGPVSRGISASEALALRHRGAAVELVSPDAGAAAAMGLELMDPSRRAAVIAAGRAQGMRLVSAARAA